MFCVTLQPGSGTTKIWYPGKRRRPRQACTGSLGARAEPYGRGVTADMAMAALADLMTAHPGPARRVILPDLRGLFTRSCLRAAGDLGLHLEMVRLTAQPMPVEGLTIFKGGGYRSGDGLRAAVS